LEKQRLQQDPGDRELQEPSDDELSSREVIHGGWMIPDAAGYSGWAPETRVNRGHPRPQRRRLSDTRTERASTTCNADRAPPQCVRTGWRTRAAVRSCP